MPADPTLPSEEELVELERICRAPSFVSQPPSVSLPPSQLLSLIAAARQRAAGLAECKRQRLAGFEIAGAAIEAALTGKLTLDELQKLHVAYGAVGAGLELLRRLREVVPLLETALIHLNTPTVARRKLTQALALVQGTAESAKCSSCNGRGLWGCNMTCPRCGGTGTAESATGGEVTE